MINTVYSVPCIAVGDTLRFYPPLPDNPAMLVMDIPNSSGSANPVIAAAPIHSSPEGDYVRYPGTHDLSEYRGIKRIGRLTLEEMIAVLQRGRGGTLDPALQTIIETNFRKSPLILPAGLIAIFSEEY